MSHTPGPWKIYANRRTGEIEKVNYLVEDCGSYEIDAQGTKQQWVAHALEIEDARLIAAAPDLLATLEPFAKFAEHWDTRRPVGLASQDADVVYTVHFLLGQPPVSITLGDLRAARAAIAKAKGEA